MNNYTDIMIDLETFATDNDAAIVSIGAVAFNADGDNASLFTNSPDALERGGQGFRANVNLAESAPAKRGNIDPATVEWWLGQSQEARDMLVSGERVQLGAALEAFVRWLYTLTPKVRSLRVWSNGPTFDETILRAAFRRYASPLPLSYRGSRCCRTMLELAELHGWDRKEAAAMVSTDTVKHDALSDAVFQARGVVSQRHFLRLAAKTAVPTSSGPGEIT